jgi:hypothetical protein
MKTKQTAVEWLADNLHYLHSTKWDDILEQAKAMEKEQMIDFARLCLNKAKDLDILSAFMNVQQYYLETYGGESKT